MLLVSEGSFSKVYANPERTKATKQIPVKTSLRLASVINEIAIMKAVSNPFVMQYQHSYFLRADLYCIDMEYLSGGDLTTFKGTWPQLRALTFQICKGLVGLHSRGVIHRDIKPANILLDGEGKARIIDFGVSCFSSAIHSPIQIVGSPCYIAPEIIARQQYDYKVDIWSLGICLFELQLGRMPFANSNREQYWLAVTNSEIVLPTGKFPNDFQHLLRMTLVRKPTQRATSAQLLGTHSVIQGFLSANI